MAVVNLTSIPFAVDQVAIAVAPSDFGGGHIGLGFHAAKTGPHVLHLAWHRTLQSHAIPQSLRLCWAAEVLNVPPSASRQLVALVRVVAARLPTINYGINFLAARGSFVSGGAYKAPKGSDGLTCATFVVEVLRAGMIDLVKTDTWRSSPSNVAWGERVCAELARTPGAGIDEHVIAVRRNVNGLRVRPFEVAGAAQLDRKQWPATFDDVQPPAEAVEAQLKAICQSQAGGEATQQTA